MFPRLAPLIENFDPISLDNMDNVRLLNRIDSKYLVHISRLPDLLNNLKSDYFVLSIQNKRIFRYQTLYYDTKDSEMFMDHHNGKNNRYKIRIRDYMETNCQFLEIKHRNNKGRTIKERIQNDCDQGIMSFLGKKFISDNSPYNAEQLENKMYTNFSRITLVNKCIHERVTIDFNLVFENAAKHVPLPSVCIIELKYNRCNSGSCLGRILKEHKIRPVSLSKYCVGTVMLDKTKKANRFKPILNHLKKL